VLELDRFVPSARSANDLVSRTRHSVPSAVHGRAWTKNAKTTPCKVEWTRLAALLLRCVRSTRRKRPQPNLIPLERLGASANPATAPLKRRVAEAIAALDFRVPTGFTRKRRTSRQSFAPFLHRFRAAWPAVFSQAWRAWRLAGSQPREPPPGARAPPRAQLEGQERLVARGRLEALGRSARCPAHERFRRQTLQLRRE
jgi:hypothetical protein